MKTISNRRPINLKVVRFELDFSLPTSESLKPKKQQKVIEIPNPKIWRKKMNVPQPPQIRKTSQRVEDLIEELLDELYSDQRGWGCGRGDYPHRYTSSAGSFTSSISTREKTDAIEKIFLEGLELSDLQGMAEQCTRRMRDEGTRLARQLRLRDKLRRQQNRLNDGFTVLLRHATVPFFRAYLASELGAAMPARRPVAHGHSVPPTPPRTAAPAAAAAPQPTFTLFSVFMHVRENYELNH